LGTGAKIGIGVGVSVGVILLIIVAFLYDAQDDARLADINASYDDDTDRLTVSIFLTDSNAEDTKANGNAELTIFNENRREVYSATYNFVKDDFVSWKNVFTGDKRTAYVIAVKQFFPSSGGEVSGMMGYEVYVDLNTKTKYWEDLYDEFWSFESEPIQQQVPAPESEPIQQQVPAIESEPIQQQVPAPGFEDVPEMIVESENNCDPSYPDVCIPTYPPDLNCKDVPYKKFKVLQPDPHGFDGNKDGIGCES